MGSISLQLFFVLPLLYLYSDFVTSAKCIHSVNLSTTDKLFSDVGWYNFSSGLVEKLHTYSTVRPLSYHQPFAALRVPVMCVYQAGITEASVVSVRL